MRPGDLFVWSLAAAAAVLVIGFAVSVAIIMVKSAAEHRRGQ